MSVYTREQLAEFSPKQLEDIIVDLQKELYQLAKHSAETDVALRDKIQQTTSLLKENEKLQIKLKGADAIRRDYLNLLLAQKQGLP